MACYYIIVLQDIHLSLSPPLVCVEDEDVSMGPMLCMLLDCMCLDDPVGEAMVPWIVAVGFHKQRGPVEVDRGVIVLAGSGRLMRIVRSYI